jgi:hypothetical protein
MQQLHSMDSFGDKVQDIMKDSDRGAADCAAAAAVLFAATEHHQQQQQDQPVRPNVLQKVRDSYGPCTKSTELSEYMCVYTHAYFCVCIYVLYYVHMCACMHVFVCVRVRVFVFVCVYVDLVCICVLCV